MLAQYGCEKVTQIGDIYIANIPVAQIEAMASVFYFSFFITPLHCKRVLKNIKKMGASILKSKKRLNFAAQNQTTAK